IATKLLRGFDLSLLGHVHKPQEVAPGAHYIGSPFQQDFGEKNEAKRVAVLETDTLEVEWVPIEGFPEYRVCTLDEFKRLVDAKDEHRYQVHVRNPQEAEQYYAHPLMDRA